MKKLFFIASILLLASACSKAQPVSQNQPAQNPQPVVSTNPTAPVATSTPQKPVTPTGPVTLNVYNNAAQNYKVLYTSYFSLYNSAAVKANKTTGVNFSACVPYGESPDNCFVLKNQPYVNTNLASAAVTVSVLKDKTDIGQCGIFTPQELNGGKLNGSVQGGGTVVFVTAVATDAGAGNFYETHFNRAFYGTTCYELDETIHWTNADNYSPPRTQFDTADVWSKLDILRNGFSFLK